MTLGEKIYSLRTENHMSQGDLANALDVSRQSVSKWETNASIPELDKLMRMSEVFHVSLDELVWGEKAEELKSETQAPHIVIQKNGLPLRKIVGLFLLGLGLLIFLFLSFLEDPLTALFLSSPLLICAVVSFTVKRHTALWCCWILYVLIYIYLRYATGIRPWWIFHGWIYRSGLELHALIAWLMALGFAALFIITGRLVYKGWVKSRAR